MKYAYVGAPAKKLKRGGGRFQTGHRSQHEHPLSAGLCEECSDSNVGLWLSVNDDADLARACKYVTRVQAIRLRTRIESEDHSV